MERRQEEGRGGRKGRTCLLRSLLLLLNLGPSVLGCALAGADVGYCETEIFSSPT